MRMNAAGSIKRLLQRSPTFVVGWHILDNWRIRRAAAKGPAETLSGGTHLRYPDPADSVDYIEGVVRDYLRYSGLLRSDLKGKRILEIGPGDNFGVALSFVLAGAEHVVCLDRFYSKRDSSQQQRIYAAMRERLNDDERRIFDDTIQPERSESGLNPARIIYVCGKGIEEAGEDYPEGHFSLIVSRAVVEHLYDPPQAFNAMDRLLAPGGLLLHKIDLRDHGMFSRFGFHPLRFLIYSDRLYALMTRDSGKPNRHLIDYYEAEMQRLGYSWRLLRTHVLGKEGDLDPHKEDLVEGEDYGAEQVEMVESIRPKLHPRYRQLSCVDLMTTGVFLIARKAAL